MWVKAASFVLGIVFLFCVSASDAGAWEIVIPREVLPVTVTAAEELKTHLVRALGREAAVVREDSAGQERRIYLGNTRFARKQGIDFSKYGMEESLIRSCGQDIVIGGGRPGERSTASMSFWSVSAASCGPIT